MNDLTNRQWLRQLLQTPELALLHAIDAALGNSLHALASQHPTLLSIDDSSSRDPPSLRQARRLLCAIRRLRQTIRDYEYAVSLNDDWSEQQPEEDVIF